MPTFADYIDRVCIINLPEQTARRRSVMNELAALGFDPESDRVRVPYAPRPDDAHGFTSKGVYGNFLSHLSILKEAKADSLNRVMVLEDDAIFLRSAQRKAEQERIVAALEARDWGMWFGGHKLTEELAGESDFLAPTTLGFTWAHCYTVNHTALGDLINYLEETIERPVGDPRGGKMYIDAAFNLFRRYYPQHVCLVSNPAISIQKGVTSNLGAGSSFARHVGATVTAAARSARDEIWRWTGRRYGR